MRIPVLTLTVLSLLAAGAAAEGEKVDNPQYAHWSKFKVGTWVRVGGRSTIGEGASAQVKVDTKTTQLVELTKEKAVLLTKGGTVEGDVVLSHGDRREEVPAKIEKPKEEKPDPETPVVRKEGEETLEVAGRKIKCRTLLETVDSATMKVWSKTWKSDDVPGQVVKIEENWEKPTKRTDLLVLEDYKAE